MEVRSVTLFAEWDLPKVGLADFLAEARVAFPVPVQTVRWATPPFPDWWRVGVAVGEEVAEIAGTLQELGVNYLSLGAVQLGHDAQWLEMIPALLGARGMVFAAAEVADCAGTIEIGRCSQIARLIQQNSQLLPNGFGNLYFTVLANCPAGCPFFPVAYHQGGAPHFALAVEAADLVVQAFTDAPSLAVARQNLVGMIEQNGQQLREVAERLAKKYGIAFSGLDFSLAPFPTETRSLEKGMELLGLPYVGAFGSLFVAALITEAIQQAQFKRCGFSGLMLPVLEDVVLAQRAAEGVLGVGDLLSYAAVCGVGLDTLPLAGDVAEGEIAGILLDLAALATRLRKPLTARLMPMPGLVAGDPITFDFPYFANSRVMKTKGVPVQGWLAQPATVHLAKVQPVLQSGVAVSK